MRKLFLHIFVACMMFYVGIALSKPIQPAPPRIFRGVDELQLVEIFKQYGPAQTTHDRAFFERVESDHFILFQPYRQLTREEDIRVMDTLPMGIKYTWEIENIRVFGDSAVVTGQMRSEYRDGSSYSWGSINVCIKTTKGWQILSTTSNY